MYLTKLLHIHSDVLLLPIHNTYVLYIDTYYNYFSLNTILIAIHVKLLEIQKNEKSTVFMWWNIDHNTIQKSMII